MNKYQNIFDNMDSSMSESMMSNNDLNEESSHSTQKASIDLNQVSITFKILKTEIIIYFYILKLG
jgi:hypothetical protein